MARLRNPAGIVVNVRDEKAALMVGFTPVEAVEVKVAKTAPAKKAKAPAVTKPKAKK